MEKRLSAYDVAFWCVGSIRYSVQLQHQKLTTVADECMVLLYIIYCTDVHVVAVIVECCSFNKTLTSGSIKLSNT